MRIKPRSAYRRVIAVALATAAAATLTAGPATGVASAVTLDAAECVQLDQLWEYPGWADLRAVLCGHQPLPTAPPSPDPAVEHANTCKFIHQVGGPLGFALYKAKCDTAAEGGPVPPRLRGVFSACVGAVDCVEPPDCTKTPDAFACMYPDYHGEEDNCQIKPDSPYWTPAVGASCEAQRADGAGAADPAAADAGAVDANAVDPGAADPGAADAVAPDADPVDARGADPGAADADAGDAGA